MDKYMTAEEFEFNPHDKYSMFEPKHVARDQKSIKAKERFKAVSPLMERTERKMKMLKNEIIKEYQSEGDSRRHIADLAEKNGVSKQEMRRYLREDCGLEVYEPIGRVAKKEDPDDNILEEIQKKKEKLEPAAVKEEKLPDLPEEVFTIVQKSIDENKQRIEALLEEKNALKEKNVELIKFIATYKGGYKIGN